MLHRTPIERAVATYCPDWQAVPADKPGICKVNPETLNGATSPDLAFRYIDISSVTKGHIDWQSVQSLRLADAPSRARRVVRPGDILLCTVRPLLGSHAAANWSEQDGYVCSTGFAVIRPFSKMSPNFLRHLPFCEQVTRQLVAWQCGTNYPAVNETDVRALQLPMPPPEGQAGIAQLLDAVDKTIQCTREAAERARDLDHSLLHDLLEKGIAGRHRKKKPNWPIHRLDEVADVGYGVTLGKDVSGFKNVELPYLRVANVQDGHLDLSTIKTVRVRVEEVENYRLEPGDVLMTEGGDLDKLGRGTIWNGEIPNCLHQNHIFRVRAKQDQLRPYFLSLVVESDIAKRHFLRVAKRTTNLASINKTALRAFRFPVPEPTEQEEIENVMKAAKATVKALSEKESALLTLKKSLMHDLLTGAVRVKASLPQVAEAV